MLGRFGASSEQSRFAHAPEPVALALMFIKGNAKPSLLDTGAASLKFRHMCRAVGGGEVEMAGAPEDVEAAVAQPDRVSMAPLRPFLIC